MLCGLEETEPVLSGFTPADPKVIPGLKPVILKQPLSDVKGQRNHCIHESPLSSYVNISPGKTGVVVPAPDPVVPLKTCRDRCYEVFDNELRPGCRCDENCLATNNCCFDFFDICKVPSEMLFLMFVCL